METIQIYSAASPDVTIKEAEIGLENIILYIIKKEVFTSREETEKAAGPQECVHEFKVTISAATDGMAVIT